MTIAISMMMKPFVISAFIVLYRLMIMSMWKYLPYKVNVFFLKER